MPTYPNGGIPYSVVSVVLATGTDENGYYEMRCTPAFAARWAFAKAEAMRRFGRTIYVRTGWNIYRPYNIQVIARNNACDSGNCSGASVAGYSSHGGNWNGRDCLAVDVDPNGLSWDQVDEAMEAAGFSARLITQAMSGIPGGERWHYIDFNAFGPIPAGLDSEDFDMPLNQEDLINILQASFATGRKKPDGTGEYVSIAAALGAVYFYGDLMNKLITALPDAVWSKPLKHALSEKMIPAGDFLRYEPAEHQNTRNALDGITVDVDPVVAAVREALTGIPGVDPAAVEEAAQAGAAAALQALTLKAV